MEQLTVIEPTLAACWSQSCWFVIVLVKVVKLQSLLSETSHVDSSMYADHLQEGGVLVSESEWVSE